MVGKMVIWPNFCLAIMKDDIIILNLVMHTSKEIGCQKIKVGLCCFSIIQTSIS